MHWKHVHPFVISTAQAQTARDKLAQPTTHLSISGWQSSVLCMEALGRESARKPNSADIENTATTACSQVAGSTGSQSSQESHSREVCHCFCLLWRLDMRQKGDFQHKHAVSHKSLPVHLIKRQGPSKLFSILPANCTNMPVLSKLSWGDKRFGRWRGWFFL